MNALDKSIEHWEENLERAVNGERFYIGSSYCALCNENWHCEDCPLCEYGMGCKDHDCESNPWGSVQSALWDERGIVPATEIMYMALLFVREARS